MILEFSVTGTPVPQGSMQAFVRGGKAHVVAGNAGPLERWRGDIRGASRPAIAAYELPAMGVAAVKVALVFRFLRPASHFLPANGKRQVAELRASAPATLTARPDVDKLARAVLDALTGIVWDDDDQVTALYAAKRYVELGEPPGVGIRIVPA